MNDSKYCPRIHHGLIITQSSKKTINYGACCWGKEVVPGEVVNFDHGMLQNLRLGNQQNELPKNYCQTCISQENAGKHSMRQGYIATHGDATYTPGLQYLDINLDYTCNLACVTCGPALSTTWRKELKIHSTNVRPDLDKFTDQVLAPLDLSQL